MCCLPRDNLPNTIPGSLQCTNFEKVANVGVCSGMITHELAMGLINIEPLQSI